MLFKQINELRKTGNLIDAYNLAVEFLKTSDSIWAKRAMAWVLVAYIKENSLYYKRQDFLKYLNQFIDLKLENTETEEIIYTNIGYWLVKFSFELVKQTNLDFDSIQQFYDLLQKIDYKKPSETHSKILSAFLKISEKWFNFYDFLEWWNLENLQTNDYESEELPNKKLIISLAERAYICKSKYLLKKIDSDKDILNQINLYIEKLETIEKSYPSFVYIPFYIGKLLLAKGEKQNALIEFLPFARKKINDFWVWEMFGDIFSDDTQKLACYCRALLCKSPDKMLVNLRPKIAELMVIKKYYNEAKYEIDKTIETRKTEEWKITGSLMISQGQDWYKNAILPKNNFKFYQQYANQANALLYMDYPEQIAIIDFVNADKKILNFIVNQNIMGFFKYQNFISNPQVGDFLELKLEKRKTADNEYYNTLFAQKTNKTSEDLIREFKGELKINHQKKIGFVGSAFISPDLYQKYDLQNFTVKTVTVKAVLSYNKMREQFGWKAIEILI